MSYLLGIHAVEEALQAGRPLDRIVIAIGRHGTRMEEIVRRARERGVPVRFEDRGQLDRLAMSRDHQGVIALAASRAALALEDLLQKKTGQSLLVLLDGVEDPQNLGAVVRTARARPDRGGFASLGRRARASARSAREKSRAGDGTA